MTHTALRVETNRAALQGRSRQRSFHSPLTGVRAWTSALDQIVAPADTNRPRGHRARSGSAGMTATARRIRSLVTARTTAARCADMLDTRGRARSRSQVALFGLRERDRLLRAGRRARPLRTAAHLAAQRADARGRPGRHARPLPAHRRHSPARALTTQPQAPAAGAGRAGHTRSVIQAAVTQPAADTPTLSPTRGRDPAGCHRPCSPTGRPGRFKVATAPFSSQARFRAAARPAFRALSTTGSPQGGNQR
jgi:hypothetical protein